LHQGRAQAESQGIVPGSRASLEGPIPSQEAERHHLWNENLEQSPARQLEMICDDGRTTPLEASWRTGPESSTHASNSRRLTLSLDNRESDLLETKLRLAQWKDEALFWKLAVQTSGATCAASGNCGPLIEVHHGYPEDRHHSSGDVRRHEESFLRRLSQQLGRGPDNTNELITKLIQRLEDLMTERVSFGNMNKELRRQIGLRERELHLVRAEMGSEISALKAGLLGAENERKRAIAEREQAENQLLDISKYEDDVDSSWCGRTVRLSQVDLPVGGRRDNEVSEMFRFMGYHGPIEMQANYSSNSLIPESFQETRANSDANEDMLWNDSPILAAIQSLRQLINSKDSLLGRNKELKERLKLAAGSERATQSDYAASIKALAVQQDSSNEELYHVVGVQERIIANLLAREHNLCSSSSRDDRLHELNLAKNACGDVMGHHSNSENDANVANAGGRGLHTSSPQRRPSGRKNLSQAIEYLQEQLNDMNALCEQRLDANGHLHATIRQLEVRSRALSAAKTDAENNLRYAREEHETWVRRVASTAGLAHSMDAIESFVRNAILAPTRSKDSTEENFERIRGVESRLSIALVQKRFLLHIIDIYSSKYHWDILAATDANPAVGVKFRRVANAVIACVRARFLSKALSRPCPDNFVYMIVSRSYNVPSQINGREYCHGSGSELYLAEPTASCRKYIKDSRTGTSADDNVDIGSRKSELAHLLQKSQQEREALHDRLHAERLRREAAEDATARSARKVVAYKKRLSKAKEVAEKSCSVYRSAILSLTEMARNSVESEKANRSSIDTVRLLAEVDSKLQQAAAPLSKND
jgi:hypothetical protein